MTLFDYFSEMGVDLTSSEEAEVKQIVNAQLAKENKDLTREVEYLRSLKRKRK